MEIAYFIIYMTDIQSIGFHLIYLYPTSTSVRIHKAFQFFFQVFSDFVNISGFVHNLTLVTIAEYNGTHLQGDK